MTGLPGPVETLPARVDVAAPRYALPPDQVPRHLPAGQRAGRVHLPAAAGGAAPPHPALGALGRDLDWLGDRPRRRPWLALVLLAEGEGQLRHDVPVAGASPTG